MYDYQDPPGGSHLLEAATLIPIGKIAKGAKVAERGLSVIGHCPDYLKRAEEPGARRFNAPEAVWNRMTEAERWAANQKLLDRAIRRGDAFELATPLDRVRPGIYLEREIGYLLEQGYRVAPDGSRLLPP